MCEHRLIFHIGTPKTGTSTIQRFLYDNSSALEEQGVCYPDLVTIFEKEGLGSRVDDDQKCKNGAVLSSCVQKSASEITIDMALQTGRRLKELLRGMLADGSVLVSEETIWTWDTSMFLKAMMQIHDNIDVIVYLRRQDAYMKSGYNQRVKRYMYCTDDFATDMEKRVSLTVYHYLKKLDDIASVIGEEHLFVRVYEKQQLWGGDLISDFLATIGISIERKGKDSERSENESLSLEKLELKRMLNRAFIRGDMGSHILEERILKSFSKTRDSGTITYTRDKYESNDIMSIFASENEMVAKKYLGRKDGRLFYEEYLPRQRVTECERGHAGLVVSVLADILYQQYKELLEEG